MTNPAAEDLSIIVIDDDPAICLLLKEALQQQGAAVEVANNRSEALQLAASRQFHLAFLDMDLSGHSGLEMLQELRANNPGLVGIIMSGTMIDSFAKLVEYQVDDYLSKPFSLDQIAYLVARHRWSSQATPIETEPLPDLLVEAAHQLKSPLAVIKEFTHLLQEGTGGDLTDKQANYLAAINENVELALLQVSHLEQLNEPDGGQAKLSPETINLSDLLQTVLDNWQPILARHQLQLDRIRDSAVETVLADRQATEQILYNLLDNARKYAPPGTAVTLSTFRYDDTTVCIQVADEGPGIPRKHRETIFEAYRRLPNHQADPGLGLGLTIALRLAHLMKGELLVVDGANAGACFILRLPDGSLN